MLGGPLKLLHTELARARCGKKTKTKTRICVCIKQRAEWLMEFTGCVHVHLSDTLYYKCLFDVFLSELQSQCEQHAAIPHPADPKSSFLSKHLVPRLPSVTDEHLNFQIFFPPLA